MSCLFPDPHLPHPSPPLGKWAISLNAFPIPTPPPNEPIVHLSVSSTNHDRPDAYTASDDRRHLGPRHSVNGGHPTRPGDDDGIMAKYHCHPSRYGRYPCPYEGYTVMCRHVAQRFSMVSFHARFIWFQVVLSQSTQIKQSTSSRDGHGVYNSMSLLLCGNKQYKMLQRLGAGLFGIHHASHYTILS